MKKGWRGGCVRGEEEGSEDGEVGVEGEGTEKEIEARGKGEEKKKMGKINFIQDKVIVFSIRRDKYSNKQFWIPFRHNPYPSQESSNLNFV